MSPARRILRDPVALAAAVSGLIVVVLLVAYVVAPRSYVTGGNGVRPLSLIATVAAGERLCAVGVDIPAETAGIQVSAAPESGPADARVTVSVGGREVRRAALDIPSFMPVTARFAPLEDRSIADVCIETGSNSVALAGAAGMQSDDRPLLLGDEPVEARLSMLFVPEEGARRSLAGQWATVMDRAAVFRPSFVTATVLWVVLLVLLPVALVTAVVGVVVGVQGRRAAVLLGLVALASFGSWAVVTLPFDSPDESEHFAYVQSVAERQVRPDSRPTSLGTYSAAQTLTLEALRHPSRIGGPDQRPPWNDEARERYERRVAGQPQDNGGGYAETTRLHLPAYYSLLVPAYLVAGDDVITQMTLARFMSALLGIVVAFCAFGIVRELLPTRPELALTAGLLIALHPMYSFIAGAVNNDVGVNAGAGLVAYLGIRLLRRPAPWVLGAFGVALALTPLMKATGYSLFPPAVLVLAGYVWRHPRWRPAFGALAGVSAAFVAVSVLMRGLLSASVENGAVGTGEGEGAVNAGILGSLGGKLSYTWQVMLPRLPFMQEHFVMAWPFYDIYIVRGWGSFGWYSFNFPKAVFVGVIVVLAGLLASGLVALWNRRADVSRWIWEVAFLLVVPITVLTAVSFAYYTEQPNPVPGEQGRYLFTAAAPLAGLAAGALLGLPRGWQRPAAAVLVVGMAGLAFLGRLTYLVGVFT